MKIGRKGRGKIFDSQSGEGEGDHIRQEPARKERRCLDVRWGKVRTREDECVMLRGSSHHVTFDNPITNNASRSPGTDSVQMQMQMQASTQAHTTPEDDSFLLSLLSVSRSLVSSHNSSHHPNAPPPSLREAERDMVVQGLTVKKHERSLHGSQPVSQRLPRLPRQPRQCLMSYSLLSVPVAVSAHPLLVSD
jgi:hypothetical protein